jgi:hypothetical protein
VQVLLREPIEDHIDYRNSLDRLTLEDNLPSSAGFESEEETSVHKDLAGGFKECRSFIFGGDSTANAMMIAFFHITRQPDILERLKAELGEAWPKLNAEPTPRDLDKNYHV